MKRKVILMLFVLLISGCDSTKDVEYWKTHIPELSDKLDECAKNPAKATTDGNCINANGAQMYFNEQQFLGKGNPLLQYQSRKQK